MCVVFASDIDECQTGLADCAHGCRNTRGSFMCVCPAAYELGVDGKQCYREYDLRSYATHLILYVLKTRKAIQSFVSHHL